MERPSLREKPKSGRAVSLEAGHRESPDGGTISFSRAMHDASCRRNGRCNCRCKCTRVRGQRARRKAKRPRYVDPIELSSGDPSINYTALA